MMWRIKLQQKHPPECARYYAHTVPGNLTVTLSRAASYSNEEAAQAVIAKLTPHLWGKWVAEEAD